MSDYATLEQRIANKEVIILDGAVGTQLQAMGVPMSGHAWAAMALETHPYTVRRMHEDYIRAGVDVITTNTYSSARHNLEPLGLGDHVRELNLRAAMLAQDARDKAAKERPVLIGGSVSNFGLRIGLDDIARQRPWYRRRTEISERQARDNLREQAEILAEAGVDLIIAESTGGHLHRKWVTEACASVGLPLWTGFKVQLDPDDRSVKVGYVPVDKLADTFDEVMALGGSVVNVFHSSIEATDAALPIVREKWQGPIGAYPEAERRDYVAVYRDETTETPITPDDFIAWAKERVADGVQIIGGCCGIEMDYIRPLREALPERLPEAA